MTAKKKQTSVEAFEKALLTTRDEKYVLRLYVAGMSAKSLRAVGNLKKLCEEHLRNQCEVEVIDIYQQPLFLKEGHIVAVPTLVKELPLPVRQFIGDLSNTKRVIAGLDLRRPKKRPTD